VDTYGIVKHCSCCLHVEYTSVFDICQASSSVYKTTKIDDNKRRYKNEAKSDEPGDSQPTVIKSQKRFLFRF